MADFFDHFTDRLRTIIGYDKICVMDAGTIAEFDTPANLFVTPNSIFRGMCDRSSITLDDIGFAAKEKKIVERQCVRVSE